MPGKSKKGGKGEMVDSEDETLQGETEGIQRQEEGGQKIPW